MSPSVIGKGASAVCYTRVRRRLPVPIPTAAALLSRWSSLFVPSVPSLPTMMPHSSAYPHWHTTTTYSTGHTVLSGKVALDDGCVVPFFDCDVGYAATVTSGSSRSRAASEERHHWSSVCVVFVHGAFARAESFARLWRAILAERGTLEAVRLVAYTQRYVGDSRTQRGTRAVNVNVNVKL